jgi:quinol monooxygenase YgiN
MIEIVWQFQVVSGKEAEFERHYGPQGTWVQLFRRTPAFIGTALLRDRDVRGRYLTIDRWNDLATYDSFRDEFAAEYKQIDAKMESLTQSETKLGTFEAI